MNRFSAQYQSTNPFLAQSGEYRFGFNGKEVDSEGMGGDTQDYGFRIYNSPLGRFLSIDPLAKQFAYNSVYAFAEGNPIENIDLDGLEKYNYRMTMSEGGEIITELVSKTDIVERVIVGYRMISHGMDISVPIYETRVNARQEYTLNGRNTSLQTINELTGVTAPDPMIQSAIDKIRTDYVMYSGQFPNEYYVSMGRQLFEYKFSEMEDCTQESFEKAASQTWGAVDTDDFTLGTLLFHVYESFVRQNDDTGYDKLQHFVASAA